MAGNPIPGGLRGLPLIGDELTKVGRVIQILNTSCSPTPAIWVQAFFYRLPVAIFAATKPELFNITPYVKSGNRRVGHRRQTRRNLTRRFRVKMDTDAIFRLTVDVGEGLRWVPIVYNLVQRTAYWLLIADVTTDFAVLWTSTAYTWQGCSLPDEPWASGSRDQMNIYPPIEDWYVPQITRWTHIGMAAGGNRVQIPKGHSATLFGSCLVMPQAPPKHGVIDGLRFRDVDSGEIIGETHDPIAPGRANLQALVSNAGIDNSRDRIVQMEVHHGADGYAMSPSASFECFCFDTKHLLPDP